MKMLPPFGFVALAAFIVGCETTITDAEATQPNAYQRVRAQRSERQLDVLRTFALQESPSLWQTVQTLQSERELRKVGLENLKSDLLDFGRDPDTDVEYQNLEKSYEDIEESIELVYCRIEDAYIAYKKYQATPGKNEYGEIMRNALEDGIREADAASNRYRNMTKSK